MTAGEPTKVLEAELPLAPSATWNESWYRIEKIGASGKKLVCGNEPSAPMANLLIAEVERLFAELERLVGENQQLKQFKDKFHYLDKGLAVLEVDKRLSALKEKVKPARANELPAATCLVAGSAGLGAALALNLAATQAYH